MTCYSIISIMRPGCLRRLEFEIEIANRCRLRLTKLEINQVVLIDTFLGKFNRDHRIVCSESTYFKMKDWRWLLDTKARNFAKV